jgi:hypothetical protein
MHPLEEAALRLAVSSILLRVETLMYVVNMTDANNQKARQSIAMVQFEIDAYIAILDTCPPTVAPSVP